MKKIIKKITGITLFCLLFPFLFTLIWGCVTGRGQTDFETNMYEPKLLDKYIIIEGNGYEQKLDVEQFIPCVLADEMSVDSPKEALKAQAVVIRTYILKFIEENISDSETSAEMTEFYAKDIGLDYTSYGEMKKMWGRNFYKYYNLLNAVISETNTEVITYEDSIIMPFFHSASSGMTRDGEEVFESNKFAYLKSVSSKDDSLFENYTNEVTYTTSEFFEKLDIADDENITDSVRITKMSNSGYVLEVMAGEKTYSGYEISKIFNLQSECFSFTSVKEGITIKTKGSGHGFGLSIQGAINMANSGNTYDEILNYYYENIQLKNE